MKQIKTYACYLNDDNVRLISSSGAVFSVLASYVFSLGGVVYGVTMAEDCYSAEFVAITCEDDINKLRGSKYLQAKIGNTYKNVKKDLLQGKTVMFTGTSCQVNGLKKFLEKDYENLICIDIICHGAPSPALWKKYAQYQEVKNGGKLVYVNFRCKDEKKTTLVAINKVDQKDKIKIKYISKNIDSYMQMFLKDYCLRPSCYECVAKNNKMSDITIADFWGIDAVVPGMNDGKGISLVLVRSELGQSLFNILAKKMELKEVAYESGVKRNLAEYMSCIRPPQRDAFFNDMYTMSFEELKRKYIVSIKFSKKVERKIKNLIKTIIRRVTVNSSDYGMFFLFKQEDAK